MAIETLFSTTGYGRKTHLIIDGVDACNIRWSYPLLVWDCGGEVSPAQVELFKKGIDPDNHLCKRCMRRVVAHLTQRATDGLIGYVNKHNPLDALCTCPECWGKLARR